MAPPFDNEPITADHLPRLRDENFEHVDPRYLRGWRMVAAVLAAAVVVAGVVAGSSSGRTGLFGLLTLGGLALVGALLLLWTLECRRLAFQVREHDISLRSGVLVHRVESIPFTRVQHVNIHRGVLERSLGLATVEVTSAGPNISIPGLTVEQANKIRSVVIERAGMDDADESTAGSTGGAHPMPLPPPVVGQQFPPPELP